MTANPELTGAWLEAARVEARALELLLGATTISELQVTSALFAVAHDTRRQLWERMLREALP